MHFISLGGYSRIKFIIGPRTVALYFPRGEIICNCSRIKFIIGPRPNAFYIPWGKSFAIVRELNL